MCTCANVCVREFDYGCVNGSLVNTHCVCVYTEKARERECLCVYICVCVCEREKDSVCEKKRVCVFDHGSVDGSVVNAHCVQCMCVRACVCVRVRVCACGFEEKKMRVRVVHGSPTYTPHTVTLHIHPIPCVGDDGTPTNTPHTVCG